MNKAAYALKLPQSLKTAAQRLAREDSNASPADFQEILDKVRCDPPTKDDELPEW